MEKFTMLKCLHIARLTFILACLFMANSCAVNPVTGKKQVILMSEEKERAIGEQSDPAIVASYGLYDDPELQKFIDEKGQEMAAISHRQDLDYEFKILDTDVVNAFALPGGFVYFTRGILAHFNNEAEFAGVLGHEIGHITARHGARQHTSQILGTGIFIAGVIVSPEFAQFANEAQQGLGLLFLSFSRAHESESDKLGVEYSTKIGYDAHNMANFFKTLDRMSAGSDAGSLPTFLSTHPDPADRYNNVNQLATEWSEKVNGSELRTGRSTYLGMIDGLIYGPDPRQGYVDNQTFYHPELKFQYPIPEGWRTNNTPSQVQMAPPDGKVLMLLSLAEGTALDAAADKMVQESQLNVLSRTRDQVNGLEALVLTATQQVQSQNPNQQAQTIKILTYFIKYGDLIYKLDGLAYESDFDQYVSNFRYTMNGFSSLSDPERINVLPERIKIVEVDQSTSLRAIFEKNEIPEDRMEELAILNSLGLEDLIDKGTLIKVVERK